MKKIIKQVFLLSLIVSFASCNPDEDPIARLEASGNTILRDTKISRLEKNSDIRIKIITAEGITATKVEVYFNEAASANDAVILGTKIADATISGEAATFNSSTLPDFEHFGEDNDETTGTFALAIVATYSDGSVSTNPYTLTIAKGINWQDADFGNTTSSGVSSIKYRDTTEVKIRYAVYRKYLSTVVEEPVKLEWKKNKLGTYQTDVIADVQYNDDDNDNTIDGSINLATTDYAAYGLNIGDTLYYKFTAKSGSQTDFIETKIAIVTQDFGASKSGMISSDTSMNKFNLATATLYDDTTTKAEIAFMSSFGIKKEGVTAITFVKTLVPLSYDDTDLFDADAAYNLGVKLTSLTGLNTNDVILYKITRNVNLGTDDEPYLRDVNYYGLLKVGDKTTGSSETFAFKYKEGILKL